jgi:hypothetical protein
MPVVEPHAEPRVGQELHHRAFKLDQIFFGQ